MYGARPLSDISFYQGVNQGESSLTPGRMHFKQQSHFLTIHQDEAHSPFTLPGDKEGKRKMDNLFSYLNMSQR